MTRDHFDTDIILCSDYPLKKIMHELNQIFENTIVFAQLPNVITLGLPQKGRWDPAICDIILIQRSDTNPIKYRFRNFDSQKSRQHPAVYLDLSQGLVDLVVSEWVAW